MQDLLPLPVSEDLRKPHNGDLTDLLLVLNERFETIQNNFSNLDGSAGNGPAQRTFHGGINPVNPYSHTNPVVDVYEFLDPLYARLRVAAMQVREINILPNAVGQNQLQIDSVIARHIVAGSVTADKISVNELSAIAGNIGTITAGNITLDTSGFIRAGATTYATGTGFWLGYDGGAYKMFLGAHGGDYLQWDGANLSIAGSAALVGSVDWDTQVTNRPIDSDGRVIESVVPSAVPGLFLSASHMGYHDGSAWKTYMDSSGTFYLGGPSGALTWNGTTLNITGGGTFSGALSAATGTFAGALSAASGTFAGTLSAATGSFSGAITSTSGTIGGWTLAATNLQGTNTILSTTGYLSLGTGNDIILINAVDATYRLWVGHATASSAPFFVTKAGALTATNATITGAITATSGSFTGSITSTSGTIGGWTIAATNLQGTNTILSINGYLSLGTGNDIVLVNAVDATYRLWVGHATASSAPFYVTKTGALVATNASITGTITSTSGTIGGFTIGANHLQATTGSSFISLTSDASASLFLENANGSAEHNAAGFFVTGNLINAVHVYSDGTGDGRVEVCTTDGTVTGRLVGVDGSLQVRGIQCRNGTFGSGTGNRFNLYWTGSLCELWIDNTKIGTINTTP
jgi:hypothetical protein